MKLMDIRHAMYMQVYNKGYSKWGESITLNKSRVSNWVSEFGDCLTIEFKVGTTNTLIKVSSDDNTDIVKSMNAKSNNIRSIATCLSLCLRHVERSF